MSWLNDATVETAEEKQAKAEFALRQRLTSAIQQHLDATAQERGYDGILSLASYATSMNPKFKAEGQAGVEWRDAVWSYCYEQLAKVEAGERSTPNVEELVSELPVFEWPL